LSQAWDFQEGRTFQPRCGIRAAHPTETMTMRFYTRTHRFYCGIDLHARTLHLCVLDQAGAIVLDKNIVARPETFLKAIAGFRDDVVVGVECMYAWYWLADLCAHEKILFVLGHALYMKLIYGAKAKKPGTQARHGRVVLACRS
jgi:hypothetical protein